MRSCATEAQAKVWWQVQCPPGIAAVCGAVSGGLEVIDFDREAGNLSERWRELVEEMMPGLLGRVCLIETPRRPAGYHVWFRTKDFRVPGNSKLASLSVAERAEEKALAARENRKAEYTLIETRGEGGYALVPGCPPECHENHACYRHVGGVRLEELPAISEGEREILILCARELDRDIPAPEPIPKSAPGNNMLPGTDFDLNGWDWAEILEPYGWTLAYGSVGRERRWRRPGKKQGWSATTGHCFSGGADLLRVFSDNADPFKPGPPYGKFRALALLGYNGDLSAAARYLGGLGFGRSTYTTSRRAATPTVEPAVPSEEERERQVATISDLERAGAEVSWLWEGWLQCGVVIAIASEAGTGKTRFCADLLRRIAHGLPWPDGSPMLLPRDSKALWVVSDNHHDEMVNLCRDFGIRDNVCINAWADDPYGGVALDAAEDFRDLELRVQKVRPTFVIVDTVGNATDRNLSKQEDARAFYSPLQVLARRYRTTVIAVTHLNTAGKFLGRRVLEKVRAALRMDKPDPGDDRRALELYKTFGKKPAPLGLTMGDAGNEYDNAPPKAPVGFEPGLPTPSTNGHVGRPATASVACADWLRERLKNGPVRVSELRTEAELKGWAAGTLYPVGKALSVIETLDNGRKWWSLNVSDEDKTPWED